MQTPQWETEPEIKTRGKVQWYVQRDGVVRGGYGHGRGSRADGDTIKKEGGHIICISNRGSLACLVQGGRAGGGGRRLAAHTILAKSVPTSVRRACVREREAFLTLWVRSKRRPVLQVGQGDVPPTCQAFPFLAEGV